MISKTFTNDLISREIDSKVRKFKNLSYFQKLDYMDCYRSLTDRSGNSINFYRINLKKLLDI